MHFSRHGRITVVVLVLFLAHLQLRAQNENNIVEDSLIEISEEKLNADFSFSFKTQNVFRGLLPSAAPTLSTNIGISWNNFILGMYGGIGVDGVYQETDYLLIYSRSRFDLNLEYYYNFTQGITDIPEPSGLFDFDRLTTRGLLDFIVNIRPDKKRHWDITSATFLFGRDSDLEEIIDGNDTMLVRTTQRYSQYLELAYSWYWKENKVQAHIGGSFSWASPDGPHFYGPKPGLNNIGLSFSRKVVVNNRLLLPAKVTAYVNPLTETTYLIFSINLIQIGKL